MLTMTNRDLELKKGQYVVFIDPVWNPSADRCPAYKDILVQIYSKQSTDILPMKNEASMEMFATAMKKKAKLAVLSAIKREYTGEYEGCYRIETIYVPLWYYYIFIENTSKHQLREEYELELVDVQITYPLAFRSVETEPKI